MPFQLKYDGPGVMIDHVNNLSVNVPSVSTAQIVYHSPTETKSKNGAVSTRHEMIPMSVDKRFKGFLVNGSDPSAYGGRGQDSLNMGVTDTLFGQTVENSEVVSQKTLGEIGCRVQFFGPGVGEFGDSTDIRKIWIEQLNFLYAYLAQGVTTTTPTTGANANQIVVNKASVPATVIGKSAIDHFLPTPTDV